MTARKKPKQPKRGAPAKLDPAVTAAIVEAVAAGVPEKIAAEAAGICRQTLTRWKKEDEAFSDSIKRARAQSVKVRVERIRKVADGGQEYTETSTKTAPDGVTETVTTKITLPVWTADAWWLERQMVNEFGANRAELKELLALLREIKGKEIKGKGAK